MISTPPFQDRRRIDTLFAPRFVLLFVLLVSICVQSRGNQPPAQTQIKTLGPVSLTVELEPRNPVIGDLLELKIEVVAESGVEVLMPEFGEALGRFQIVDFRPRESIDEKGRVVLEQRYKLQTPSSGKHAIPPILVEFVDRRPGEQAAPSDRDAYELFSDRVNFEVQSVTVESATEDLDPPLGRLDRTAEQQTSTGSWMPYLLVGIGAVTIAALLVWFGGRIRKQVIRRTAYEIARRQLDGLTTLDPAEIENVDRFYVELTSIIRNYLENRFDLKAPELTTEEFLSGVSGSGELSGEHKQLLRDFLRHADLVKFAGVQPTVDDIRRSLQAAVTFLEETRENSPMIVLSDSEQQPQPGRQKETSNQNSEASNG